jgi:hypothetical protein
MIQYLLILLFYKESTFNEFKLEQFVFNFLVCVVRPFLNPNSEGEVVSHLTQDNERPECVQCCVY